MKRDTPLPLLGGHAIETLDWHSLVPEQAAGRAHLDRIAAFLSGSGLAAIDEVFTRVSASGGHRTIDTLEVDIGRLPENASFAEWAERLKESLYTQLLRLPREAPEPTRRTSPGVRTGHRELDAFLHYLRHGHLPWSVDPVAGRKLAGWLEHLARQHGARLWDELQAIPQPERVLERLGRIAPHHGLQALIAVRHTELADSLMLIDRQIVEPLQARGKLGGYQADRLRQAWRRSALSALWGLNAGRLGEERIRRLQDELAGALGRMLGRATPVIERRTGPRPGSELGPRLLSALLFAQGSPLARSGMRDPARFPASPAQRSPKNDASPSRSDVLLRRLDNELDSGTGPDEGRLIALLAELGELAAERLRAHLASRLLVRKTRAGCFARLGVIARRRLIAALAPDGVPYWRATTETDPLTAAWRFDRLVEQLAQENLAPPDDSSATREPGIATASAWLPEPVLMAARAHPPRARRLALRPFISRLAWCEYVAGHWPRRQVEALLALLDPDRDTALLPRMIARCAALADRPGALRDRRRVVWLWATALHQRGQSDKKPAEADILRGWLGRLGVAMPSEGSPAIERVRQGLDVIFGRPAGGNTDHAAQPAAAQAVTANPGHLCVAVPPPARQNRRTDTTGTPVSDNRAAAAPDVAAARRRVEPAEEPADAGRRAPPSRLTGLPDPTIEHAADALSGARPKRHSTGARHRETMPPSLHPASTPGRQENRRDISRHFVPDGDQNDMTGAESRPRLTDGESCASPDDHGSVRHEGVDGRPQATLSRGAPAPARPVAAAPAPGMEAENGMLPHVPGNGGEKPGTGNVPECPAPAPTPRERSGLATDPRQDPSFPAARYRAASSRQSRYARVNPPVSGAVTPNAPRPVADLARQRSVPDSEHGDPADNAIAMRHAPGSDSDETARPRPLEGAPRQPTATTGSRHGKTGLPAVRHDENDEPSDVRATHRHTRLSDTGAPTDGGTTAWKPRTGPVPLPARDVGNASGAGRPGHDDGAVAAQAQDANGHHPAAGMRHAPDAPPSTPGAPLLFASALARLLPGWPEHRRQALHARLITMAAQAQEGQVAQSYARALREATAPRFANDHEAFSALARAVSSAEHAGAVPARVSRAFRRGGSLVQRLGRPAAERTVARAEVPQAEARDNRLERVLGFAARPSAQRRAEERLRVALWLADPDLYRAWESATRPRQRQALLTVLFPDDAGLLRRCSRALFAAQARLRPDRPARARLASHWAFLGEHLLLNGLPPSPDLMVRRYALHLCREDLAERGQAAWSFAATLGALFRALAARGEIIAPGREGALFHQNALRRAPDAAELRQASGPVPDNTGSDIADEAGCHSLLNAGIVLLANYSQRLFGRLELLDESGFRDGMARSRAVRCLAYLVDGHDSGSEPEWVLPKLLCGMPFSEPVVDDGPLDDATRALLDSLLLAVIAHWTILGNTSPDGLRETFLQREGRLAREDGEAGARWRLTVKPGPFDMLLDRLPWSYSTIKLPWMREVLHVDWR
ncbi:contractile injection system tape measure protein [Paludibacterium paludis]|uniref:Uncharacterized protein n=1 Tax=Paludibacterium paludis TaxID=1225769 RepID=A0A918U9L2_9NEIS|nr:contractile injection system tape measure protein [Paludibacterium paludis]GGY13885.1 hypothetical protein GCM10011289_16550 [Paludibacterium paludis]